MDADNCGKSRAPALFARHSLLLRKPLRTPLSGVLSVRYFRMSPSWSAIRDESPIGTPRTWSPVVSASVRAVSAAIRVSLGSLGFRRSVLPSRARAMSPCHIRTLTLFQNEFPVKQDSLLDSDWTRCAGVTRPMASLSDRSWSRTRGTSTGRSCPSPRTAPCASRSAARWTNSRGARPAGSS